jgi:D-aspartate ligase
MRQRDATRAPRTPVMSADRPRRPLACVMGDIDMVRPLGLAGLRCMMLARPGDPAHYSRFTERHPAWENACWDGPPGPMEEHVGALVRFGLAQPEPPVLFYVTDAQLLFVSRHREQLAKAFRFVIAGASLVEDLVDKTRFHALAERLDLPVPATRRIRPTGPRPADPGIRFPIIIKPPVRREPWQAIGGCAKVLRVESAEALRELWPRLVAVGMDLLVQELIPGPETCIESYHVYVDHRGAIAAEFTGRKIRTYPECYGASTALEISDAEDVRAHGRAITRKLNLRGVAKVDFKRGADGRLRLLEVNPRFNLWHHLGAIAGVNLPRLVYGDLIGLPRPPASRARSGVRWCRVWSDVHAARAQGIPLATWLPWALRCEAKPLLAWDDPMPLVRVALRRWLARLAASKGARHAAPSDARADA